MRKRRTALAAAICTLVLICVLASTFFISSMSYQTERYKVTLPNEMENTNELGGNVMENQTDDAVELPELTPENVQAVIASLPRPEQYTGSVTNTLYSEGDEAAVWRAVTYYKNDAQRVELFRIGAVLAEVYLYYNNTVFAWEQGSTTYWSSAAGAFTADMTAMIPSYRDVCQMPTDTIKETEMFYDDGTPCIRVICGDRDTEYTVSLISGLLENVKYYENGEMVREVMIVSAEEEIADSFFVLPGDTEPAFASQK